ncbi:MAG: hypothetical protein A2033_13855 [Bacteroidetes bacterium GWA2_31_9]|nr:MAG: hypothetical protein A2033_13855 [Bacteroidetes bacterium GWA2_31_9]
MELSAFIFWDTDYTKIDWQKKARYVLERVVMFGTANDWRTSLKYYGKEKILSELQQSKILDAKCVSFLSCIFNVPKEDFRCYTNNQSENIHWNF